MTTADESVVPNHHAGHDPFSGRWASSPRSACRRAWSRVAARARHRSGHRPGSCRRRRLRTGHGCRQAAARGARVTGIDPAPIMRTVARILTRDSSRVTWADGTAEALPLPDQSATVLWSIATVHHWVDVPQGLAEAHRRARIRRASRRHREQRHAGRPWAREPRMDDAPGRRVWTALRGGGLHRREPRHRDVPWEAGSRPARQRGH